MTTTDAALVSRTQAGDEEAFRALYERHRPAVERVCRKWLRDPYLVEDAVQATFLKAWTALETFEGGAEIDRWLRRIAKNHCHDVWRGIARAEALGRTEDPSVEQADPASLPLAGRCIDRLAVENMLRNLDPRDASLLVQRHVGDMSVGALATQWGLTKGAMDVALHRARVRARRLAEAEGLRGLLPLGLLRRWSVALQRFGIPAGDAGVVLMGVCNIAVAVTLAAPTVAPAYAEERPSAPDAAQEAVALRAVSLPAVDQSMGSDTVEQPTIATGGQDASHNVGGAQGGYAGPSAQPPEAETSAAPPEHKAVVKFDPITVPAGGPTVSSTPGYAKPERTVGVRVGGDDYSWDEDPNSKYDDQTKPVIDAACTAAKAGDPVTYCED